MSENFLRIPQVWNCVPMKIALGIPQSCDWTDIASTWRLKHLRSWLKNHSAIILDTPTAVSQGGWVGDAGRWKRAGLAGKWREE